MKNNFEIWLDSANIPSFIQILFRESVLCYKASAYRGALLLAYIGFMGTIRKRLQESKRPSTVSEGEWNSKIQLLSDDDVAEQTVFELLNRSDNKYFKLTDSIRNQIRYWKDRRNDCAHLKSGTITSSHVEMLWSFVMDNINKIVVPESRDNLIVKIHRHFDETYTPVDSDITAIVLEIPKSVEITQFREFLLDALKIAKEAEEENFFDYMFADAYFLYTILVNLDAQYGEIAKSIIKNNPEVQESLFYSYPKYLTYFSEDPSFIRAAWKTYLDKVNTSKNAATLLRCKLIPTSEIKEFISDAVRRNRDSIPKDADFYYLNEYGYSKLIDEFIINGIEKNAYEWWVQGNQKFIKFYLKQKLNYRDDSFVDALIQKSSCVPNSNSKIIYLALSTTLNDFPEFMEYFKERAEKLSLDIDNIFFSY